MPSLTFCARVRWLLLQTTLTVLMLGSAAAQPGPATATPRPVEGSGSRVLRVGVEIHAAPTMFADAKGEAAGFAPDLVRAVAAASGLQITFLVASWEEIHTAFQEGRLDLLAHVVKTTERTSSMDFAVSHLTMEGAIFTKTTHRPLTDVRGLADLRVAVQPESFTHLYLRREGLDRKLVFYPTLQTAFTGLSEDACDAVIAVRLIGNMIIRDMGLTRLKALPLRIPELDFKMHMAVQKGDAATLASLNDGLAAIRADGTYDRIYEQWIGPLDRRELRWRDLAPFVIPLAAVIICAVIAFFWQRRLLVRLNRQAVELNASRQQLSLVLEASQDGFWDWDLTTGRVDRSPRWFEMLGYPQYLAAQDLAQFHALIHPDDLTGFKRTTEDLLRPGSPPFARYEYRIKDQSGNWRWMLDRAKIVSRDVSGRPLRIVGTGSDITVRKRTDEALQRSETLLRQSQEAAGIGGWEFDLARQTLYWTYETFRIHEIDPSRPTPSVDEAVRFYTPASQEILRGALDRTMATGAHYDLELQLVTAKGRPIWVRTVGRALRGEHGEIAKLYGSFQDITVRKAAEAEREEFQQKILETQKLESLGVLAGGVAHDFNNLLTAILANAELARLFTQEGTELDEHIQSIEKASHRAADLCRQLLAYAGRSPTSRQATQINRLVEETVQLLELTMGKNARLELDLDPNLPPVDADPGQINQVLMNLVINASESLPPSGGAIRVRTGMVRLESEALARACIGNQLAAGSYLFMEVSDTGCGMSPDTLARIFDPFFTTKFTGRGLGLAAVLGIVRSHGGGFFVESKLGQGSVFRMCLPGSDEAKVISPDESVATAAPPSSLRRARVLVVDDEETVRKATAGLLRHEGCAVETASDGSVGLERFRREPDSFDAVVLDMTMPGLDGPSTFSAMRAIRPDVRVLLISGYSEQAPAVARLTNDPGQFLRKPFTKAELIERMSTLLAQSG